MLRSHVPPAVRVRAADVVRYLPRRRHAFVRAWHEEPTGVHLVPDPVFILCPVRSGSTLLRSILNSHRRIHAPHEMHLATMRVTSQQAYAIESWSRLGFSTEDLENMLWDRALHRMLVRSGKRIIVDKTPQNVNSWQRIHAFWPKARYVHLRRHPLSIASSLDAARPDEPARAHVDRVLSYGRRLAEARAALPGPSVRYEDLVADPQGTVRGICAYLGVRWQPSMLRYRAHGHAGGLGDWSDNIHSGRIQAPRPVPAFADVPAHLQPLAREWGYG